MQTFEPLISVFLPTFARCGGGHLERAIRSVLSQTYQNLELFVVDDGSVDGSKEVIEHFCAEDSRVKQFRFEINTGLPAYNTGICYAKCRGSCLAWIFDDCVWRMHHLEVLVRELSASPSAGFVYSKALSHFAGGNEVVIGMPYDEKHMQKGNNHIANVATLVTRKAVEAVGWYDPHVILKRFCDWDLWTRIWKVFGCAFVDEITADEYGTGLADSLGNTHTLFPSVILKYAATERNAMLVPSR